MMFSVKKIDKLMERMTLAEKLGQLTMTAAGYAVTGPVIAGDSSQVATGAEAARPMPGSGVADACVAGAACWRGGRFFLLGLIGS